MNPDDIDAEELIAVGAQDYVRAEVFYEHGQWWLRAYFDSDDEPERTFSIVECLDTDGREYYGLEEC